MLFWITNCSSNRRKKMNKQVYKNLATGVAIGVSIAVSKTIIMGGALLMVEATLPNNAFEEKPTIKQRMVVGIVGSALIGVGAIGVKASIAAVYPSSRFKIIKPNKDLPNTK